MNQIFRVSEVTINATYINRYGELRGCSFTPVIDITVSESNYPPDLAELAYNVINDLGIEGTMIIENFSNCLLDGVPLTSGLFDSARNGNVHSLEEEYTVIDTTAFTSKLKSENISLIPNIGNTTKFAPYNECILDWMDTVIGDAFAAMGLSAVVVAINTPSTSTPSSLYTSFFDYVVWNATNGTFIGCECTITNPLGVISGFLGRSLTNKIVVSSLFIQDGVRAFTMSDSEVYYEWKTLEHYEKTNRDYESVIVSDVRPHTVFESVLSNNIRQYYSTVKLGNGISVVISPNV